MLDSAFKSRENKLFFYSPFNFIREIAYQKQLDLVRNSLVKADQFVHDAGGQKCVFYYQSMTWDTDYFGINTYKLINVLFEDLTLQQLSEAVARFVDYLSTLNGEYCFIEAPSEDIFLIEALGKGGFKLVETRLTYYRNLANYDYPERFAVRSATQDDVAGLREVAGVMRNDYDRFHADPIFSLEKADEFLATYVEQSVKGYTDLVLVPDYPNEAPDAFLTANFFKKDWDNLGVKVSKMVLSAVSSSTRKGWYKKLISEMSYHLREQGAEFAFMNTQSTNRAVFHTWESLGYKLGGTTHILTFSK